ncbi:hypothetical protein SNOG_12678 [Parastagonospora nodorum SN15]|uniref:Uncharacterized protein n=1 Tax=Phaeosphaeria nodorum (strain SN15 / ATCC MYA-4574 / FGSC 10173) TaxID=321614 RepID=Q0U6D6_PHANO|nr:hypothetical protein SNOG_12678 [Parastagonospora nodorum SN15]EAT79976.1 hypothetical protein SNOG_12678 [Parastagonospora nodorum SN15]
MVPPTPTLGQPVENQEKTTTAATISDDLQSARQYRQTQEYPSPSDLLARKNKTRQIVPGRWECSITQYPAAGGRNGHPWDNPPALLPRQYVNGETQGSDLSVCRILYADGLNDLTTLLCNNRNNVNVSLSLCQSSAASLILTRQSRKAIFQE